MRSRPLSETDHDIVRQVPFLSALGGVRLDNLMAKCRVECHSRGEHLFRAGDVARNFYVLLSGHLRLVKVSPQGEETIMHFLTQPGAFAEAVSLAGRAYPVECEVMEDCDIIAIPRDTYLSVLRSAPDVMAEVLAGLLRWERFFLEEIFKIRHTKPIQRIASFLIDFEERSGENLDGDDETNFPEKRQIASRIGITPETFSRSLRKLEAAGAIASGSKLRILDRTVLHELSR